MVTCCLTSPGKEWQAKDKAPTEGWRVTWDILGSDSGCHRRNLGKHCYIRGALLSSSICHSDFDDHLIWPWSIYISCVQNQASEMQIRRGSWTVLCRKPVEGVIPETVLDAWSWHCISLIMGNSLLWWEELLHTQEYNGTNPFFSLLTWDQVICFTMCKKCVHIFWQSQLTFQDDMGIFTMLLSSCFFII